MLTRRKAFTIIELMLVVGVLVILIGLVAWGLKGAGNTASDKATRITLQNLTNMSEELNRKNKLTGFEGPQTPDPLNPIYPIPPNSQGGETAPGLVTSDSKNFDRLGAAVHRTAEVMRRLQSIPDNKNAIAKFPSDQLLAVPQSGPYAGGTVVLDGWKNPILFVPTAGLADVMPKPAKGGTPSVTYSSGQNYAKGARVVNSDGYYWTANTSTSNAPAAPDWFRGIRSPDGRSFWASAGPDGTFGAPSDINAGSGDDNIYSFEQ